MSCGCNRKRVKHNTVNHSDILRKLKKGVVKVITKNNLLLCTHYDESLPSKNSKNYRDINNQHKNKKNERTKIVHRESLSCSN